MFSDYRGLLLCMGLFSHFLVAGGAVPSHTAVIPRVGGDDSCGLERLRMAHRTFTRLLPRPHSSDLSHPPSVANEPRFTHYSP